MKHKTLTVFIKLFIVFGLFGSFSFPNLSSFTHIPRVEAGNEIQNWWPVDGVKLEGKQPFKALVNNMDVKDYTMYWQVDNGQLNKMDTSLTDYPHKEATVDLSSWHWRDNGIYLINFVAKDSSGTTIGQKEIRIYVNYNESGTVKSAVDSIDPITTIEVPIVSTPTPLPQLPVSTPTPAPQPITEEVWWPTNNATIDGVQPFKALLKNRPLEEYTMYWQVDNGQLNEMKNVADHKEALVDITNWTWKDRGPYTITFTAKDTQGKELAHSSIQFTRGGTAVIQKPQASPTPVVAPRPTATPSPAPTTIPTHTPTPHTTPTPKPTPVEKPATPSSTGNPFSGVSFYVNPNNNALKQAQEWKSSRPVDAQLMEKIANEPDAKWIGNWNANVYQDVKEYVDKATAHGAIPVMIAYNIPSRDCGSYSAGGADNAANYEAWIKNFANGIGNRKAAIILEPDALAGITCLDQAGQASRLSLLKNAVSTFKAKGNVSVYIDAGNSNWVSAEEMAPRLKKAGIEQADGFALNVSNYYPTADSISYGTRLSPLVGNKHFVVDTSRNGQGALGSEWCNPQGRGLGKPATTNTGNTLVDAFMWLKNPGESDGQCNGGPSAGVWWPEYALGLAKRAEF